MGNSPTSHGGLKGPPWLAGELGEFIRPAAVACKGRHGWSKKLVGCGRVRLGGVWIGGWEGGWVGVVMMGWWSLSMDIDPYLRMNGVK